MFNVLRDLCRYQVQWFPASDTAKDGDILPHVSDLISKIEAQYLLNPNLPKSIAERSFGTKDIKFGQVVTQLMYSLCCINFVSSQYLPVTFSHTQGPASNRDASFPRGKPWYLGSLRYCRFFCNWPVAEIQQYLQRITIRYRVWLQSMALSYG